MGRVRYAELLLKISPWSGQSGRTDPASESGTAYSGNFAFEQSESWIENLLDDSDDVESWGYGSVGWTYQGNNAYMEGRGIDDVNYTRWGGNGGTHTGGGGEGCLVCLTILTVLTVHITTQLVTIRLY